MPNLAFAACVLITLWPALWNGAPGLFTDTVEYVELGEAWAWGYVRPAAYGFAMRLVHWHVSLWPVAVAQAALLVWLVRLVLRVTGLVRFLLPVVAVLALCSAFAWTAIFLTPDLFAATLALAGWLLACAWHDASRQERVALGLVVFLSCALHLSVIPLAAGLALLLGFVRLWGARTGIAWRGILVLVGALAAACLVLAGMGLFVYGHPGFVHGGPVFYLARLVGDGLVERYLAETCATESFRLCAFQGRLPTDSDVFLWSTDSPLFALGRMLSMRDEAQALNSRILRAYPLEILANGVVASLRQFVTMRPGDGMDPGAVRLWEFYAAPFFPEAVTQGLRASRQATMHVQDWWLTLVPTAGMLAATAATLVLLSARLRLAPARVSTLLLTALAVAAGNAVVIGFLSAVHERYQARVAWLAVLALLVALLDRRQCGRAAA